MFCVFCPLLMFFDICNWPMRQELQLILEQHGFKLHRFTKMQVLFNSKYYRTTWLVIDWILRCWGTVNMYVCACMLAQLRTPFDPMNCSPPGSSVREILQARILKWAALFSVGHLPDPGIKPTSLMFPALTGEFSYQLSHQGSPWVVHRATIEEFSNLRKRKDFPSSPVVKTLPLSHHGRSAEFIQGA